jgi:hypothetical protein
MKKTHSTSTHNGFVGLRSHFAYLDYLLLRVFLILQYSLTFHLKMLRNSLDIATYL